MAQAADIAAKLQRLAHEKSEVEKRAQADLAALREELDAANEKNELLETEIVRWRGARGGRLPAADLASLLALLQEELRATHEDEIKKLRSAVRDKTQQLLGTSVAAGGSAEATKFMEVIELLKEETKQARVLASAATTAPLCAADVAGRAAHGEGGCTHA
jgi:hypothetical protein